MKYSLVIFFMHFLIPTNLLAQAIQWQNTIGGSNGDFLLTAKQTSDGGYVLGGTSSSDVSGDKTENSKGLSDYWLIKLDAAGNIQWQHTIGGSEEDKLYSINLTMDGGFILGGISNSNISGDKTENCFGWLDYWIVKTDSLGNIQWQKTIGGTFGDLLTCVKQTPDSGYILGGHSFSNISGNKSENNWDPSLNTADYWIVKTDSVGNIEWQNTIGGNYDEQLSSIELTDDGGYVLGGDSWSDLSGDKTEGPVGSPGSIDYWIIKLNASGNIIWQNTIGANASEDLETLSKTLDGGFILGGSTGADSSGDKTENGFGNYDYWIVKINGNGIVQWDKTYGGDSTDWLNSIAQSADSGYIISGVSMSDISGYKNEISIGEYDYWLLKTDATGNIQWQNTIGGNEMDWLGSAFQTSDGGYLIEGFSSSNMTGDKGENCLGQDDIWILKLSDKFNSITGKIFIDLNSNGIQDPSEFSVSNSQVTDGFTSKITFSDREGKYNLAVLDSGNYLVTPSPINYYSPVPANRAVHFTGIHQIDSLNDFAFQPAGTFNDLCVTLTPLGRFRAGREASYMLSYENVGTTTLNGTVIFYPDSNLIFFTSAPAAVLVTSDSTVWNVGTLAPFQTGSILVTVQIDASAPVGTPILSNARIEPIAGDANAYCNNGTWGILVTGSFDPNEILVDRNSVFTTELSNPLYLEYIINFQNTGNDSALDVKVLNPIDTSKLQINSLEFVASSHSVNMSYKPWESNMEFSFNNIYLPDSNVNEPASHGFVRYRIKPKSSLLAGDSILNTAYIYFDFNQPVQTNTAFTQIILPTSIDAFTAYGLQFTVYPNPLTQQATIAFDNPKHESFELSVSDITGRLIESIKTTSVEITLKKGGKRAGVYLISLTRSKTGERSNAKIVIGD